MSIRNKTVNLQTLLVIAIIVVRMYFSNLFQQFTLVYLV